MRGLVQRVSQASVAVNGQLLATIDVGLLVLVGVTHGDTPTQAAALAGKVRGLRVLRGESSLADVPAAAVLAVSQFSLYGDARKGRRPSWAAAAPAAVAEPLVAEFVSRLRELGTQVQTGVFGADMQVSLVNDGPLTLMLEA